MSGMKVERPRQLELNTKRVSFDDATRGRHSPPLNPSPKKLRLDPEIKQRRRRTHSCTFFSERNKRRQGIVVPTKFLLGGNITDPLNLEALGEGDDTAKKEPEMGNRGGETVKVIIPPNINDPLNLDACSEDGEEQLADAISRQRRRRKGRKRKRRNSEPTSGVLHSNDDTKMSASVDQDLCKVGTQTCPLQKNTYTNSRPPATMRQQSCPAATDRHNRSSQHTVTANHSRATAANKRWRTKTDERIVSPVIKQPGVALYASHRHHQSRQLLNKSQDSDLPKNYHPKNELYQHGNYSQYYGYRNPEHTIDPRLAYFQRVWFEGKDVLDIGCNIGHITFLVARDFMAKKIIGIDIDKKLINVASKNFKHYMPDCLSEESRFPKSVKMYGSLKPVANKEGKCVFPHNVRFYQNNYVLESEELLNNIKEEFDCILCLSVTKWVHLNYGDDGLKRVFSRIYKNLRQDGLLILEPQAWPSYKKKRKLTPKIFETYKNIKFHPTEFEEFLTKKLGFFHVHTFRVDHTFSRGFHRLLYVFRKPTEAERKIHLLGHTLDKSSQTEEYSVHTASTAASLVTLNYNCNLVKETANPAELSTLVDGPIDNTSPESMISKFSIVESTKSLVIDSILNPNCSLSKSVTDSEKLSTSVDSTINKPCPESTSKSSIVESTKSLVIDSILSPNCSLSKSVTDSEKLYTSVNSPIDNLCPESTSKSSFIESTKFLDIDSTLNPNCSPSKDVTDPDKLATFVDGSNDNLSPESTTSKSSLVESTKSLVIDSTQESISVTANVTSSPMNNTNVQINQQFAESPVEIPIPEPSICEATKVTEYQPTNSLITGDNKNNLASTVGSTTYNFTASAEPSLDGSNCDSTTDEIDHSNPDDTPKESKL